MSCGTGGAYGSGNGNLGPGGPVRRVDIPWRVLMQFPAAGAAGSGTLNAPFSAPTPDARVQLTVKIMFRPDNYASGFTYPFDTTIGGRVSTLLNLQSAEYDDTGILLPTNDLVGVNAFGTVTGGQVIPVSQNPAGGVASTVGFSLDVPGGQGAILGLVNTNYLSFTRGAGLRVLLSARWNAVAELTDREWQEIVGRLQLTSPGKTLVAV